MRLFLQELSRAAEEDGGLGLSRLAGRDRLLACPADADGIFVARAKARADLRAVLGPGTNKAPPAVLLRGPAGVGKSALAGALARDCLDGGAWSTAYFVDLGGCRDVEEACMRISEALEVCRLVFLCFPRTIVISCRDGVVSQHEDIHACLDLANTVFRRVNSIRPDGP
eukprot:scaffold253447_cov28-Prasinocladus_malaysianus.AAC.1